MRHEINAISTNSLAFFYRIHVGNKLIDPKLHCVPYAVLMYKRLIVFANSEVAVCWMCTLDFDLYELPGFEKYCKKCF
jgi:hypothetical protein